MSIVGRYFEKDTPISQRITNYLSREHLLTEGRHKQYGVHPRCLTCRAVCEIPQYNAPGLTNFTCTNEEK